MPYVEVKVAGKLTPEQRRTIAKDICETLKKTAGKDPKTTYVVFQEIERENWAVGDKLLSDQ